MSAEFVEDQKFDILFLEDEKMARLFQFFDLTQDICEQAELYEEVLSKEVFEQLINSPENVLLLDEEYSQILEGRYILRQIFRDASPVKYFPINIKRLITDAKTQFPNGLPLSPFHVLKGKKKLKILMTIVKGKDKISKEAQKNSRLLFNIYLDYMLSSKKIIIYERLGKESFDWLVEEILSRFKQAIIHPGEMVGILAA